MALVIDLKPGEKLLIGSAVITNDAQRTRLHIAGDAPIMREKDVMKEQEADTPCKRVYFMIQCMYLAKNPKIYHDIYFKLIKEIQQAAPSTALRFMAINDKILDDAYYKALKEARELIKYEEELLRNAQP
jgi:flagellar protein FlbT